MLRFVTPVLSRITRPVPVWLIVPLLVPILSIVLPQGQIPILPQLAISQSLAVPEETSVPTPNSESILESQETGLPIDSYNTKVFTQSQFERNFLPDAISQTTTNDRGEFEIKVDTLP